ncbi:MAG: spore coat protein CotJB [Eubacterium sp.]|nr:spore coat protein CotJB [Eubacterium sp.]
MNQAKNRRELLSWINRVSFMVNELTLYLDTHPDDQQALDAFSKYNQMRCQALSTYAAQYGPLNLDTVNNNEHWCWATQPWPWEGGCC